MLMYNCQINPQRKCIYNGELASTFASPEWQGTSGPLKFIAKSWPRFLYLYTKSFAKRVDTNLNVWNSATWSHRKQMWKKTKPKNNINIYPHQRIIAPPSKLTTTKLCTSLCRGGLRTIRKIHHAIRFCECAIQINGKLSDKIKIKTNFSLVSCDFLVFIHK